MPVLLGGRDGGYTIDDIYATSRSYAGFVTGAGGLGTHNSSGDNFFTTGGTWDRFGGAHIQVTVMTSYTTVVNITSGSGVFFFALSGAPLGNGATTTLRITLDGTTREIEAYQNDSERVIFMAAPISTQGSNNVNMWLTNWPQKAASSSTTSVPATATTGAYNVMVPAPGVGMNQGVRFSNSCLVEMKSTSGWRNSAPWNRTLAALQLDT